MCQLSSSRPTRACLCHGGRLVLVIINISAFIVFNSSRPIGSNDGFEEGFECMVSVIIDCSSYDARTVTVPRTGQSTWKIVPSW